LTGISIDSLAAIPQSSIVTKTKNNDDVYMIYPEDYLNFKQRNNYITKLYSSKSEGLIRYDKQDSVYWELVKKYKP
jgi:hypothetical protein